MLKEDKPLQETTAYLRERTRKMAELVINEGYTTRRLATFFRVSKTTAHKDLTVRLSKMDKDLYNAVREVLDYHRSIRHLRGGMATMHKHKGVEDAKQHK
jgi:putative DeoR family transcriptional regulator (stage III sporulation protein D)